jgi:FlgD Ig-like domain
MPATSRVPVVFLPLLLLLSLSAPAEGQWSDDPYQNLAICDQPYDQVLPLMANMSDGGCYIGWFGSAGGNYNVYLQRLDPNGNKLWADEGLLVSDQPQSSSLTAWDLICDSGDNCILTFCDTRAGADLDIYGYKIDGDGHSVWGPDGITLSANSDYEPGPCVAEAPDGNLVFVWGRFLSGTGHIMMQSVTPEGTPLLSDGGVGVVIPLIMETPGFPDVVPGAAGTVIVSWVQDMSSLYSTRHLFAQSFTTLGLPAWPEPVTVFEGASLPLGYHPQLQSDGVGGAVFIYHYTGSSIYTSAVQHLDASGAELFPHNGTTVSTLGTMHHISPTLSYSEVSGEMFAFWDERNSSQSAWGVFGQRFSATGDRLWGNTGRELQPTNSTYKLALRSVPYDDGAMVFYVDEPGGYNQQRVVGMRVDSQGNHLWPTVPLGVSTYLSGKSRLPVTINGSGMVTLAWEDDRNGSEDIYGQNIFPDGSMGVDWAAVNDETPFSARGAVWGGPNPCRTGTRIGFRLPETDHSLQINLFDASGRAIRQYEVIGPHSGDGFVDWDGRDHLGRLLPSGIYRCRVTSESGIEGATKIVLVR